MKASKIIKYPGQDELRKILSGKQLKIMSPFYSSASLKQITPKKTESVSFVTRLPNEYNMPPSFIDNDPGPLIKLHSKMGKNLSIYALPELHAKIYLNECATWVGSSNFTNYGFSEKQELLIQFEGNSEELQDVFDTYLKDAVRVRRDNLSKLERWTSLGLTKIRGQHYTAIGAYKKTSQAPFSIEDFDEWLNDSTQPHRETRQNIYVRLHGQNQMSGHVRLAFNGVMAFIHKNSKLMPLLTCVDDKSIPDDILKNFASFVREFGDEYQGPRGGNWKRYLSAKLGGEQTTGGAGDTIPKKCLVLVPAYVTARLQYPSK
ncbi:hypothetical protein F4X90_21940 [Candidatus Poribacteria bacterium]|nr:hypothetical protein [Candidatus Poribacteria bacterium]